MKKRNLNSFKSPYESMTSSTTLSLVLLSHNFNLELAYNTLKLSKMDY